MYNANTPPLEELPSSRALIRSTIIAAAVALLLLVTVVLPAEYGVDVTGIGRVIGLTEMGEIKVSLAREAAAAAAEASAPSAEASGPAAAPDNSAAAAPASAAAQSNVEEISLAPGEGKEIKLVMKKGARVNYAWTVAGGVVNYDTHGDPVDPPPNFYYGYGKGQAKPSDEGVLVAAFDGKHGWFWRNRTRTPVTVTLRVNGDYQDLQYIK